MRSIRAGRAAVVLLIALVTANIGWPQTPAPSQEDRIKALEERIILLEGQVRMLQRPVTPAVTALATDAAAPAAAVPAQTAAELSGQSPSLGGNTAAAKALNPDISVIGDFIGSAGHNPLFATPAFQMHESEVGFQAIIDPYARGDFFISFGEEGVNLEEGYITLTSLPAGFVVKGGKMRAAFGKVNTLHNHVLPWVDRPLVTNSLMGGEDGINDAGLSVTRILPAPKGFFLEGTAQVFRGDSADIFKSTIKNDVSVIGHLRGYRDLTESTNLDIGVSYARGHNDLGSRFLTNLYGVDATLRWKPLRRAIYHSFVGRSEFVWSDRQQLPFKARSFGFYTSADYQLGRRWFIGGRYDRSDRSRDASLTDSGGSLVLTYWPSEFSQIRGQYRLTSFSEGIKSNEFLMQLMFSLGAHGAHPF
jgi:hypothetical protein